MKQYIITIDGGSQSTKCVIYDTHGQVVCQAVAPLNPCILGDGGLVEHANNDIWQSLQSATHALMAKFSGSIDDIIGVGIGSIRCCRVYLDSDCALATNIINWQDTRTARPCEYGDKVKYVTSLTGYLSYMLTGQKKDNIGNYLGQYPVDYDKWQWSDDEELFKKYNLTKDMLFDAVLPGEKVGNITERAYELTGLPKGLPLFITSADKAVEMLGGGLIDQSTLAISLGTYISLAVMSSGDKPNNGQAFWTIMSSMPHKLIYEGYGIRRGMWTVTWLRQLFGDTVLNKAKENNLSVEQYLDNEAQKVPCGSDGLMTVLDWLANPWEAHKRGIIIGFNAHMDFKYMYRSMLEGIVYTLKSNYDGLSTELALQCNQLLITGGGANSDVIMQTFANVFNMPTKRNKITGAASLGAAINVSVGSGIYKDYKTAVDNMVAIDKVFMPNPEVVQLYKKFHTSYKTLARTTDEFLIKNYEIIKSSSELDSAIDKW